MINTALLHLFGSVYLEDDGAFFNVDTLRRTMKSGYVLDSRVRPDSDLLTEIEDVLGLSGEQMNKALHKSWGKVWTAPMAQLVFEQMLHYVSTYGFETLGIYDENTVYIPAEKLDVPYSRNVNLRYVRALTASEIQEKIVQLGQGMALKAETLGHIMVVVRALLLKGTWVREIKNHELKVRLYEHFGLAPNDPVDFLRYVIYRLTGTTLLIKSGGLIHQLKESDSVLVDTLMSYAPKNLASIFYRFKPIFLALKKAAKNKTFFNQLRRKAVRQHRPLPKDVLGSVTGDIKNRNFDEFAFFAALDKANIFRKIRLLYALRYRMTDPDSNLYRIRNGKTYPVDFSWTDQSKALQRAHDWTLDSIIESIRHQVDGKIIYIPDFIHYALPATEKQFVGNVPDGTYVTVDKDLVFGVYWEDNERMIDLDMSLMDAEGKIGWDAAYRSRRVAFSGDVTAAPHGASELFYVRQGTSPKLMNINYYNYRENSPVDAKIFVGKEYVRHHLKMNYLIDPSNVLLSTPIQVEKQQYVGGLVGTINGVNRFYFTLMNVGHGRTSHWSEDGRRSLSYLTHKIYSSLDIAVVLELAGAEVVRVRPEGEVEYLDLSPEALDKTTFLNILQP